MSNKTLFLLGFKKINVNPQEVNLVIRRRMIGGSLSFSFADESN